MEFILSCAACITKQIAQVAEIKNLEKNKANKIMKKVLTQLGDADFSKSTPLLIGEIWDILEEELAVRDVYKEIKAFYNNAVCAQESRIWENINSVSTQKERFIKALIFAITGNLIDLAATPSFDTQSFFDTAVKLSSMPLAIDDTALLYKSLESCKTLLYLGDNCGEIVTDKIFIQEIKRQFPQINCYYAVRGFAVLNDVTTFDADMINMHEAATVISNGSKAAGTVLSDINEELKNIYSAADVVIAKGQGNFESLHPTDKENLFFLLIAKCPVIAKIFDVPVKATICMKNKGE